MQHSFQRIVHGDKSRHLGARRKAEGAKHDYDGNKS
jgi:hypothetical protein